MASPSGDVVEVEVASPRRNGWNWPWHPQQILGWVMIFMVALLYFGFFVHYIPGLYRIPFYLLPTVLLLLLVISLAGATSINPAELSFRKKLADLGSGRTISRPKFNRLQHNHVIENRYCHLCQVAV